MASSAFPAKLIPGRATAQGTLHYASRFQGHLAAGNYREVAGGLALASIGVGTYLGEPDERTDRGYTEAIVAATQGGINVLDSASNYRMQRSERSVGAALRELMAKGFRRDEVVLCTKAGFLTPDGEMPADINEYFSREFLERGIFQPGDIAAGCHCMTPAYLEDQLERSRRNMGVECIDVFYVHNPETQLEEISREEFRSRMLAAFLFLESAVAARKIGAYGMATWNAFREDPKSHGYLAIEEMVGIAKEAGGAEHHFRFVQLPLNLAMPEALTRANQRVDGKTMAMVQAARPLGITLICSAPLLQGQLARGIPKQMRDALGIPSDAGVALQFVRSAPGVTTALVGMSQTKHVLQNLEMLTLEPAGREQFLKLFAARG